MLLAYPIFYRTYGVRRAQQLAFPKVNGLDVFHFPRNSLFHYVPEDDAQTDPDADSLYFKGYTKRFLIDYVYTLTSMEGNPRHRSFSIRTMVLPFLHAHKEFRYIREPYRVSTDINTLLVLNYGYLEKFYIYNKQLMTSYWKWKNLQNTLWAKVEEVAKSSDHNQFVFFDVPDGLPAMSYLRVFDKKTNPALLKIFNNSFKLFVLEVWKWLGEETRTTSILNQISAENLTKINLVFMRNGKWIVFNLGYLDQWVLRKSQNKLDNVAQYPELFIKKLFLRMIMTLQSHVAELAQDVENTQEEETEEKENLPADLEEGLSDDENEKDSQEHTYRKERLLGVNKQKEIESPEKEADKEKEVIKKDVSENEPLDTAVSFSDQEFGDLLETIDQDLNDLEKMEQKRLQERGVKVNNQGEEETVTIHKPVVTQAELQEEVLSVKSLDQSLNEQLNAYADYGVMPASEYRSVKKSIEKSALLKDPYGSDELISQAAVVTPQMTAIDTSKTVLMSSENVADPSMVKSTLGQYDRHYLNHVFKKDILAAVQGVKRAGVIVEEHKVETEASVLGSFEHHVIKLRPIDGKSSTLHFKVPVIKEDGTFMSNGNKYIMRKQRTDLPIRKINPTTVALSSYYGKTFIERSIFARLAPEQWIAKKLQLAALNDTSDIHQINPANVYDNYFKAPYLYNAMATVFKSVITSKFELEFDHRWRLSHFTPELLEKAEQKGARVCGVFKDKTPIVMNTQNILYAFKDNQFVELGSLYKVLNLGIQDSPLDYAAVRIFSKKIPVGFLLSYLLGFEKLLVLLGAKYRVVESGRTGSLSENEWPVRFKDRVYVFDRRQELASLILGGFTAYKDVIRLYEADLFNQKEVYFNVIESQGMGSIYLKEVDNQKAMFIDPVTKEILEEMHEPMTLEGLFVRSAEMLMNYNHPDFQDLRAMRIRGYERISGAIYRELAHSIRDYNSKSIRGRSQISLNPYAVWKTITNDNSIKIVEDINPIQNLKESEAVTYVGEGGRSRDTLSKDTRAYHPTDMGVISEATIDSGDVGINAYLSANPNFKSVRGLVDFEKAKDISNTNLLSTSALLAVGSENDDPKRVNFVSIQQSHTVPAAGYHQAYVQTGYEQVMPYRTSKLFAYMAEEDGVVQEITQNYIVVQYKSGRIVNANLGRQYGKAEGSVYPHDVRTDLTVGSRFKTGDAIAYNTGFFERDFYDPTKILYKGGFSVKTLLMESSQTHEDSSSITEKTSHALTTKTTKIKSFTLEFKQGVRNLVKIGQSVTPDDILFYIENESTANTDIFDDKSIEILKRISSQAPRAKLSAMVDRIEMFYHGDKEDMSPSLRQLADLCDKMLRSREGAQLGKNVTGQVSQDYRVAGKPLLLDTAEFRIYLTSENKAAIGDKGVFANQMKSVMGEVINYDLHTEQGEEIDAIFGFRSISARIVLSPLILGTTTTLLQFIAKKAVSIYKGKS